MDKKFVVKHKYDAAQKDELQLKPGDIVQLLEDVEPGWALGKVNGKTGLYPTNFVVPFEESTANKPTAVKTLSGGKRATDSAFKSSTKKESDQHKQDFKTEASDDEIDGAVVSVSKEVSLTKGDKSHQSGGSSSLNKNKSASQSSLDDILGETSPSHTAERKEKKSGGISSALKKIRPKHKQTASDISGDSKSTMKPSQSGENLSPTSPDQSGAGKSSGSNSSSSKMNKSMESVNSVEDEHENVSRESASSNELLSEIGKTAAVNGGTSSSPTSVVVSPEPTGIILPDNMFPAIEIDAMGGGDIPDHPQQSLGVAKKGIPRQTNKRLPSRDKIRQNAETAETDRAQAMESTAVIATSTPGTPSEDTISDLPPPRDSRVKVGPPIGAVGGNRFGGVPLPGGKDLLSQLKNRQSAIHSGSSPSPQTSVKPSTNSTNTTASAPATPPTPSSVAEARRSFAPGPGAPPPIKHTKPLLSGARPLSTVPQHSTTTTTVTSSQNPPQLLSTHSTPALSSAPQSIHLTDITSHKQQQQQQINIPPTAPSVVPVAAAYTLSSSSSPAPSQQASNPQPSTVATNPSMMVSTGATPPGIGPKPSRPPPPQVPDKPRDFSTAGAASFEAELRTVKDTVTRLERRIKELEGQLEQEQESRRRLEAKVDALVKSK